MNSGNIFSRISNASNTAAKLISDVKNSGRNVNETKTSDVKPPSAVAGKESSPSRHSSSSSVIDVNRNNNRDTAAVTAMVKEAEVSPETQYPTSLDANLVEQDTGVISSTNTNVGDYLSRFKQIALMAAHASPATGKLIAGHAQTVVKSVAVVAKSAVDSVEATKNAIRTRHEATAKVRLYYLTSPLLLVTFGNDLLLMHCH